MTIKTLQFIEVDSDPMHAYPFPEEFRDEYRDMPPAFSKALHDVADSPEEAACDNCRCMVGYNLLETDDGRLEHAYWHYAALILHGVGYPAVVLCEDCAAPVIQAPRLDWYADHRGVLSSPGMTSLIITDPTKGS